ncbi:50S ribosomal protein L30 [Flavobacterium sp. MAH-1]|uniref:Large ribosomal subunit protein uL30 n=1 Tax=Flavobacterium agri TaxID=2743471 RepID=A0A7Y9C6X6_9FLAO|nr:50S ribosomal protein L30 [Flavobacterium agri]NUY80824.1 50S ribosomal protein L30 [Flavobacterium agri]NYA70848.1 50S ribosomal protein L30 [Flavobacterium agri]
MAKLVVKQVRSQINCPLTQKRGLIALGLKRVGQVVEHESNPAILGMINKVKHLVSVEESK